MERLDCKETEPPLKSQRPGPLNDPSENLHVSGALASTAWSCKYGTFDKGPSFGSRLKLVPSKLPQAQVLVRRDVLRKEESVQGTPVLQNYGAQRVAAATLLQAENNINAAKLLPPACLGCVSAGARNCFRLRPSPWCPQKAAERHPILETPWRQTTPELGLPGIVALRLLPQRSWKLSRWFSGKKLRGPPPASAPKRP